MSSPFAARSPSSRSTLRHAAGESSTAEAWSWSVAAVVMYRIPMAPLSAARLSSDAARWHCVEHHGLGRPGRRGIPSLMGPPHRGQARTLRSIGPTVPAPVRGATRSPSLPATARASPPGTLWDHSPSSVRSRWSARHAKIVGNLRAFAGLRLREAAALQIGDVDSRSTTSNAAFPSPMPCWRCSPNTPTRALQRLAVRRRRGCATTPEHPQPPMARHPDPSRSPGRPPARPPTLLRRRTPRSRGLGTRRSEHAGTGNA